MSLLESKNLDVRRAKQGELTCDLFGFLACEPLQRSNGSIRKRCR